MPSDKFLFKFKILNNGFNNPDATKALDKNEKNTIVPVIGIIVKKDDDIDSVIFFKKDVFLHELKVLFSLLSGNFISLHIIKPVQKEEKN